ncbi:hypothetical protein ACIPIN_08720 [Pseudomonas sp. NPDC087697]|uniref:hypothetical protein n=1 Tax=Pseudomonas sp. NPDC087697 TaxID=3364447 RepID=UPI00381CD789
MQYGIGYSANDFCGGVNLGVESFVLAGVGRGQGEGASHKKPTEAVTISGFFMGGGVNTM